MLTREQIEQACKETGVPIDKFYKQGNELSWGAFRSTKDLEVFVKLFSPYLHYESIKADNMSIEELAAFYDSLRKNPHIIGWFLSFTNMEPKLWYVADEQGQTLIDVLGGVDKLIQINQ